MDGSGELSFAESHEGRRSLATMFGLALLLLAVDLTTKAAATQIGQWGPVHPARNDALMLELGGLSGRPLLVASSAVGAMVVLGLAAIIAAGLVTAVLTMAPNVFS